MRLGLLKAATVQNKKENAKLKTLREGNEDCRKV